METAKQSAFSVFVGVTARGLRLQEMESEAEERLTQVIGMHEYIAHVNPRF